MFQIAGEIHRRHAAGADLSLDRVASCERGLELIADRSHRDWLVVVNRRCSVTQFGTATTFAPALSSRIIRKWFPSGATSSARSKFPEKSDSRPSSRSMRWHGENGGQIILLDGHCVVAHRRRRVLMADEGTSEDTARLSDRHPVTVCGSRRRERRAVARGGAPCVELAFNRRFLYVERAFNEPRFSPAARPCPEPKLPSAFAASRSSRRPTNSPFAAASAPSTVRGVARRSGTSVGFVIFHFGTKDRLLLALLETCSRRR